MEILNTNPECKIEGYDYRELTQEQFHALEPFVDKKAKTPVPEPDSEGLGAGAGAAPAIKSSPIILVAVFIGVLGFVFINLMLVGRR